MRYFILKSSLFQIDFCAQTNFFHGALMLFTQATVFKCERNGRRTLQIHLSLFESIGRRKVV